MKKFKEKRMASYVLRSNELIQEGKTKEAAELFGKGLGYYSSNIIHAITPYATADAGLISTVLRHLASEIEEKNPGGKRNARMGRNSCRKAGTQRDKEN